jgi:hypothetical protein
MKSPRLYVASTLEAAAKQLKKGSTKKFVSNLILTTYKTLGRKALPARRAIANAIEPSKPSYWN